MPSTKQKSGVTYSATVIVTAVVARAGTEALADNVLASAGHVVTLELNVEVKLLIRGGLVLENREPSSAVGVADTEVDRSPVTNGLVAVGPGAALLNTDAKRVDVVLSRGGLALPLVVELLVRAGKRVVSVGLDINRNNHGLGTCKKNKLEYVCCAT